MTNSAQKADNGKLRMSTIPKSALESLARTMMHGESKYGPGNWSKGGGIEMSRYFDAAHRHLWAWWGGENIDPDSGLSHLDHALASVALLLAVSCLPNKHDDRPIVERRKMMTDLLNGGMK